MTLTVATNTKHSPTPRHIKVTPDTKGIVITSIPALKEMPKEGFQGEEKVR